MTDINNIISKVKCEEDIPLILAAYNLAHKNLMFDYTYDNKPLMEYLLGVTGILLEFNAEASTIAGNFLYMLTNYGFDKKKITKYFYKSIADVTWGMYKYKDYTKDNLDQIMPNINEGNQIMFIKLAQRLYDMRLKKDAPIGVKQSLANNTLEAFVPAGRKLGLGYISSRLEDLSFYYLEPEIYDDILSKLGEPIDSLTNKLEITKDEISKLLIDNNINHEIKTRVKSVYSIYNKTRGGKDFDDIYDILAIRILVDDEADCETAINLIHNHYEYLPDRFKNYIENPKENMYQSLHTTIIGEGKRPYEVQVRTPEMDKTAETGSASHIEYKEKQLIKNTFNY